MSLIRANKCAFIVTIVVFGILAFSNGKRSSHSF